MNHQNTACCTKPNIASLGMNGLTNRVCLSCGHHWYGHGEVKEYTRKEWDAWVEKAFDEVAN